MKNKRNLIMCFIISHITLLPSLAPGQAPTHDLGLAPDFVAEKVADIVITPHGSKWLVLRQDARIPPLAIFDENRAAFYLGKDDRMDIQRIEEDGLGFTHYPYQQLYKGLPVEGAEMLVHARDGYAVRTNGNIVIGLDLSIQPSISEEVAHDSALNAINAEIYMWESPEWEAELKEIKHDPDATYYPAAELVIARSSGSDTLVAGNYRLAYKFVIYSLVPFDGNAVYVDAQTGDVLKILPLVNSANGTVPTLYNGTRTIITEYRAATDDYILNDNTRGNGVHTRIYYTGAEYTDSDNNWNASDQKPPASGHWAAEKSFDYFLEKFDRDISDDLGDEIDIRYRTGARNAWWSGYVIWLGDGNHPDPGEYDTDPWVSLDVVGHEFTHVVDDYSRDLEYSGESGALEESFADIFGTMVEVSVEGGSADYLMCEDLYAITEYDASRDMSNPHNPDTRYQQPDTYGTNDDFWYTGSDQSVFVHTNSGVQNYWFYLLAEGGSGTNENNDSYSVISIGQEAAAAIAYRNLTVYLTSTSNYADARCGTIWAASDLYGGVEVTQVLNAWYAVGVGASMPDNITLQNETISFTGMCLANNSITAGPSVTIQSGAQILFFAGNSITLMPGFTAEAGSEFYAVVAQGGGSPLGKVVAVAPVAQTISEQPVADEEESIPSVYSLSHGYPNPFNPTVTIPFGLPAPARTRLVIYDLLGREVVRLVDRHLEPGYHAVVWSGETAAGVAVPSGIYIARIVTPKYTKSIKMLLLK